MAACVAVPLMGIKQGLRPAYFQTGGSALARYQAEISDGYQA